MGGVTKGIGKAVGGVGGIGGTSGIAAAVGQVTRGMNLSPIIQSALGTIAESGDQRAAFNAILLATAASTAKKPHFNLELEINDLFTRVGNLRGMNAPSSGGAFGSVGALSGVLNNLTSSLSAIDAAVQALAKNVKP